MRVVFEAQDAAGFAAYLREYGNTICGRHPIAVLLHALRSAQQSQRQGGEGGFSLSFVQYAQSSRCRRPDDSSVSYASAVLTPA